MKFLKISAVLLCLSWFLSPLQPSAALAQGKTWQAVGQVGGVLGAVYAQGDLVFAGVGQRLVILDVSDPTTPLELGATHPLAGSVEGITVSGDYAFTAAGSSGLVIIDISDLAQPEVTGVYDSPGFAEAVAVTGAYACLADGPYGLQVIDVTAPAHPQPVASAYDMDNVLEVTLSDGFAYLAAAGAGLLTVDLSDPRHPLESGALDTPGYAQAIVVNGTIAYLADEWEGLQVIDIADPAHPRLQNSLATPGFTFDLSLAGGMLLVADAFGGLLVVNVANPAQPVIAGSLASPGEHAGGVAASGNFAFVSDVVNGLRVIDISHPQSPLQVSLYSPLGYAEGVAVAGHFAYVAAGSFGLRVLDVSSPGRPRQTGALQIEQSVMNVLVAGDYAYLCGSMFYIADISDPSAPRLISSHRVNGACRELDYANHLVVLATETGLDFIDVTHPANPVSIHALNLQSSSTQDTVVGVALQGSFAFTGSSYAGVEVFDMSDPAAPVLAGGYNNGSNFTQDVFVRGDLAFMADYFGMQVLDISDPAQPAGLGFFETPGEVYAVTAAGSTVYVSAGLSGVQVVDVSDPAAPALVETLDTPGYAHETGAAGEYLYVADGSNGLMIYAQVAGKDSTGDIQANSDRLPDSNASNQVLAALYAPGSPPGDLPRRMAEVPRELPAPSAPSPADYPQTCVVASTADSGSGSLRACLAGAASHRLITFDPAVFPPAEPAAIFVLNQLPILDQGYLFLDASNAGVILDGSRAAPGSNGLVIQSDGNTVLGLQILHFPASGIFLQVGSGNKIGGNRNLGGAPLGQGNLISANGTGINIHGERTFGNTVQGNYIGVGLDGASALGNAQTGISLAGWCHENTIGGALPGEGNIVSANGSSGISFMDGAHDNLVIGNFAGTDVTGTRDLGNHGHGIGIEGSSYHNRIEGNLASGNVRNGLLIDSGWYNTLAGNWVGSDSSGTKAIPNDSPGVFVGYGHASFNRIGGTTPGEGNLVSGNSAGITVGGAGAIGNIVIGNWVGVDASGNKPLGNNYQGVSLNTGARVVIGGTTPAERNVICANAFERSFPGGLAIYCDDCLASGNYIGVGADGTTPVGNVRTGIYIQNTHGTLVQGNLVAHNDGEGIWIDRFAGHTLRRNIIFKNKGQNVTLGEGNDDPQGLFFHTAGRKNASGSACPGCAIELFISDEARGQVYLGTAIAGEDGSWAFSSQAITPGKVLSATATDPVGNTSEVSTELVTEKADTSPATATTAAPEPAATLRPAPEPTSAAPAQQPTGWPRCGFIPLVMVTAAASLRARRRRR